MEFKTDIFSQYDKKWALVCAGTMKKHNAMTISWGGMGTLWGRPVVTVYVKPCRYTYEFMNDNEYFTVSFYPEENRKALSVMGKLSGRDMDKEKEAGITPVDLGKAVTYQEAEVTILCKKIYAQDLETDKMPPEVVDRYYMTEAPHRMFIGEVVEIRQTNLT
ncbi:MAG: flavin reductase [Erysipelotrichaceae bacterium]|nr:flavin reductase [Erysipelotrichaceae bacterium]